MLPFWKMDPSSPGGDAECGGDRSTVQTQLKNVQASSGAFAALLEDGSVVTWGDEIAVFDVANPANLRSR